MGGLEGGGGKTQYRKHMKSFPIGLSNIESGDHKAENNNIVGCKAVVNDSAENNTSRFFSLPINPALDVASVRLLPYIDLLAARLPVSHKADSRWQSFAIY